MTLFIRYLYSNVGAVIVTFLLFLIMQGLIIKGSELRTDERQYQMVSFVRSEPDNTLQTRELKPLRPPQPTETPPAAELSLPDLSSDIAQHQLPSVAFEPSLNLSLDLGTGIGIGDGDFLPIVQVAPQYPQRALRRKVEGYTIVEFTIDIDGRAVDARIVEANPQGEFDQTSLDAVNKFRFRPRLINGEPVRVPGQRKRFNFRIN
jgi:protein TonB